ncbi:MAG: hypothetical protein K2P03_12950 [Lachnospiraceae bacterium]|jgi:hypothetical protein|nr:hypothetical protein [Lachnospiraceae bacterium]MDE7059585.1 hypothetical protein [Lachnospiraceae bacterium]
MFWTDKVVEALHANNCFISSLHSANFIYLLEEIKTYPFFCKELCKCAFTASWNQDHMNVFRQTMQEMLEIHATDCSYMLEKAIPLMKNIDHNENILYKMNVDFLKYPGQTPDEVCLVKFSRMWVPIGDSALSASEIIDAL